MLVQGTLQLPGDKSISHRAIMLSAIADGVSYVRNLNDGADLQSTINILKDCGALIQERDNEIVIYHDIEKNNNYINEYTSKELEKYNSLCEKDKERYQEEYEAYQEQIYGSIYASK